MKSSFYLSFLLLLLLVACSEKENVSYTVSVQLIAPEGYTLPSEGVEVLLSNKGQGMVYAARSSASGLAVFEVEQGHYSVSAHQQVMAGYRVLIFSGSMESASFLPGSEAVQLPLLCAESSALVIKEVYYGGCIGREGEGYIMDQYVTLYNNSAETLYLDSLCVGMVAPSNNLESNWMKHTDMKRVPVQSMAWQFPGSGTSHPLLPGAETTIATNAVDHTGGEYQHANSVNLSKVDWGFWDITLADRQAITPGVKPLKLVWQVSALDFYSLAVVGPTLMVFNLPGTTAEAYIENPDNRELEPEFPANKKRYLMIPREWVIDCVECVANAKQMSRKRVPAFLDSGAAYIPDEMYSGQSLVRTKTTTADGRTVYRDTNNSTADLEVSVPLLKK